jgi:hypothetical protein
MSSIRLFNPIEIDNTIDSINLTSGSIITSGGISVAKGINANYGTIQNNLYIGNNLTSSNISTSNQTISGNIIVGNNIIGSGSISGVLINGSNLLINSATISGSLVVGNTISGNYLSGNNLNITNITSSGNILNSNTISGNYLSGNNLNITNATISGSLITPNTITSTLISSTNGKFTNLTTTSNIINGGTFSGNYLTGNNLNITNITSSGNIVVGGNVNTSTINISSSLINSGSETISGNFTVKNGAVPLVAITTGSNNPLITLGSSSASQCTINFLGSNTCSNTIDFSTVGGTQGWITYNHNTKFIQFVVENMPIYIAGSVNTTFQQTTDATDSNTASVFFNGGAICQKSFIVSNTMTSTFVSSTNTSTINSTTSGNFNLGGNFVRSNIGLDYSGNFTGTTNSTAVNITNLTVDSTVYRSFSCNLSGVITLTDTTSHYSLYTLNGVYNDTSTSWTLSLDVLGENLNLDFLITQPGQIQYNSILVTNFSQVSFKYVNRLINR